MPQLRTRSGMSPLEVVMHWGMSVKTWNELLDVALGFSLCLLTLTLFLEDSFEGQLPWSPRRGRL